MLISAMSLYCRWYNFETLTNMCTFHIQGFNLVLIPSVRPTQGKAINFQHVRWFFQWTYFPMLFSVILISLHRGLLTFLFPLHILTLYFMDYNFTGVLPSLLLHDLLTPQDNHPVDIHLSYVYTVYLVVTSSISGLGSENAVTIKTKMREPVRIDQCIIMTIPYQSNKYWRFIRDINYRNYDARLHWYINDEIEGKTTG